MAEEVNYNYFIGKIIIPNFITEAVLAAGIFHREEVPIEAVKAHMKERGIETR